jgi:hypothetical protein
MLCRFNENLALSGLTAPAATEAFRIRYSGLLCGSGRRDRW